MTTERVQIYTDGACSGNPGPGGWGAVLMFKGVEKELSGFAAPTTNNRMEMTAVLEALRALKKHSVVDLYTDSQYVQKGLTEWLKGWKARGWKTADRKPVANADLWQELETAYHAHKVTIHWVRGHDGNEGNERADRLAVAAIEQYRSSL